MTIAKVEQKFRKYNPQLTVVKVTKMVLVCLVCAVYDISNGVNEMDSLYKYNILTGHICHFNPLEHRLLSKIVLRWGKEFYSL